MLDPEIQFHKDTWYVLQRIKELQLYKIEPDHVEYMIPLAGKRESGAPKISLLEDAVIRKLIDGGIVTDYAPSKRIEAEVDKHVLTPQVGQGSRIDFTSRSLKRQGGTFHPSQLEGAST